MTCSFHRIWPAMTSGIFILIFTGCFTSRTAEGPQYEPPVPDPNPGPVPSVVDSVGVTGSWQPPSDGAPCVAYECEWYHGQFDVVPSNEHAFTIPENLMTRMRVRGVDAEGDRGPWSDWSEWYPDGASHVPLD